MSNAQSPGPLDPGPAAEPLVLLVDPAGHVPNYDLYQVSALLESGAQVAFATAPSAGIGRLRGPRGIAFLNWLSRFFYSVGDVQPEIVHWQWSLFPPIDVLAIRRLKAMGIPNVYSVHNVLPHEREPWHAPAYRGLYRSADHLIVHSEATRNRLIELCAPSNLLSGSISAPGKTALAERITVIPMPADPVPGPLPSRQTARGALGLAEGAEIVLFFGQVRPYKGLDVLLDAMAILKRARSDVHLVVAGKVPGGSDARRKLESSVAALDIAAGTGDTAVTLCLKYIPPDQVDLYFAAADVVALPYRDTDDSAVLAAAMGRGRAVVASRVGGLAEALAGGGGMLVPAGDAVALADALNRVLAYPALRDRMEADARLAAGAWTWTDAAKRLMAVYRDVRRGFG